MSWDSSCSARAELWLISPFVGDVLQLASQAYDEGESRVVVLMCDSVYSLVICGARLLPASSVAVRHL